MRDLAEIAGRRKSTVHRILNCQRHLQDGFHFYYQKMRNFNVIQGNSSEDVSEIGTF